MPVVVVVSDAEPVLVPVEVLVFVISLVRAPVCGVPVAVVSVPVVSVPVVSVPVSVPVPDVVAAACEATHEHRALPALIPAGRSVALHAAAHPRASP